MMNSVPVWQYMLISTLVDVRRNVVNKRVWQYMLISTLVDGERCKVIIGVWQYMLISTLVDLANNSAWILSDSIC